MKCSKCVHAKKVSGLDQALGCKLFDYIFSQSEPQPVNCDFFKEEIIIDLKEVI